jgi:hypothetical protein
MKKAPVMAALATLMLVAPAEAKILKGDAHSVTIASGGYIAVLREDRPGHVHGTMGGRPIECFKGGGGWSCRVSGGFLHYGKSKSK